MKSRQTLAKSVFGILALTGYAFADQPVHCYEDQVVGDWEFEVTKSSTLPDLFKSQEVCSHELPNKLQIIEDDYTFEFADQTYTISVNLQKDNKCTAQGYAKCSWTMMYDQAIILYLPDQELMSNFRYNVKPNTKKSWTALQTGDYDEFNFICNETMAGVSRSKSNGEFSCMHGAKKSNTQVPASVKDDRDTVTMAQTGSTSFGGHGPMMFAQTGAESSGLPTQLAQTRMRTLHDVPEAERIQFAQMVNENQALSWTANAYTQIDMEHLENQRQQMTTLAQTASTWPPSADVLERAQKYLSLKKTSDVPDGELDDNFDWSNFEGIDFTGESRDQGSCGSCYMIATITMLESRIKLYYGEEKALSSQMPLQCNFLTEGCHGGWGYLGGMFLNSYYTVNENDARYKGKTGDNQCSEYEKAPKAAKVDEVYYVGGGYGQATEKELRKEIRARGPILYDFNAGYDFMTYKAGVLAEQKPHAATQEEMQGTNHQQQSQAQKGVQYQKLTHSTLVVGWGEENGMKYWKVRNSYGPNWGEQGYFKVRRGANDYGGEGENAAIIPRCLDCSKKRFDE